MDANSTFTSPQGRIVGGSVSKPQTKNREGVELDSPRWVLLVAFPKTDPATAKFLDQIKAVAARDMPQHHKRPNFAWKFVDGDSDEVNQRGRAWNTKEGYPDHQVVTFTTSREFQTCGTDLQSIDPAAVKAGSFVRVAGDIKGNGRDDKPGVYVNLGAVQFVETGPEISLGGVDIKQAFGGGAAPTTPPPPAPDVAGPVLTAAAEAAGYTVESLTTAGWTEDQMRSAGHIE